MRRIREICQDRAYKLGDKTYGWDVIRNADLGQDGILTGEIIEHKEYLFEEWNRWEWDMEKSASDKVYRVAVSLQTGNWYCTCHYSRVDVCSHAVALLIYATRQLDATVPAEDLPMQRRSSKPGVIPYRDETLRILAEADGMDSADTGLTGLLELAAACRREGDTTEALMVYLGLTEGLLYGLDYQAHFEYFIAAMDRYSRTFLKSVLKPTSMDELRIYKFGMAADRMNDLMLGINLAYEPKMLCLAAMHRVFVMTNPWEPSGFYQTLLLLVPGAKKYYEFMRRMHDPLVPTHTPDWREDPVGFRATLELAYYQSVLYQILKDPSLLDFYKRHYRDDIGTCIRYIQYLSYSKSGAARALKAECRHLFPDDDPWSDDSIPGLPSIR